MKHLKTYEGIFDIFKKKPKETDPKKIEIINLCKAYNIQNYTINNDYTVDVDGDVDISMCTLKGKYKSGGNDALISKIPIKFGKVTGYFNCTSNRLINLENSPRWVGRNFMCQHQYDGSLISLKGAPEHVEFRFDCYNNEKLDSFEHMPKFVGGALEFQHTSIYSFDFMSDVTSMDWKNTPLGNIIALFPGAKNAQHSSQYLKYIEVIKDFDPIRPPENAGDKPILLVDRLNDFLFEIYPKRTKYLSEEQTPKTYAILSKYYDLQ